MRNQKFKILIPDKPEKLLATECAECTEKIEITGYIKMLVPF